MGPSGYGDLSQAEKKLAGDGKVLLIVTPYQGAMRDTGNPCARRQEARPQGARAGNGEDMGEDVGRWDLRDSVERRSGWR
jgi:hypothetical protein